MSTKIVTVFGLLVAILAIKIYTTGYSNAIQTISIQKIKGDRGMALEVPFDLSIFDNTIVTHKTVEAIQAEDFPWDIEIDGVVSDTYNAAIIRSGSTQVPVGLHFQGRGD